MCVVFLYDVHTYTHTMYTDMLCVYALHIQTPHIYSAIYTESMSSCDKYIFIYCACVYIIHILYYKSMNLILGLAPLFL